MGGTATIELLPLSVCYNQLGQGINWSVVDMWAYTCGACVEEQHENVS